MTSKSIQVKKAMKNDVGNPLHPKLYEISINIIIVTVLFILSSINYKKKKNVVTVLTF